MRVQESFGRIAAVSLHKPQAERECIDPIPTRPSKGCLIDQGPAHSITLSVRVGMRDPTTPARDARHPERPAAVIVVTVPAAPAFAGAAHRIEPTHQARSHVSRALSFWHHRNIAPLLRPNPRWFWRLPSFRRACLRLATPMCGCCMCSPPARTLPHTQHSKAQFRSVCERSFGARELLREVRVALQHLDADAVVDHIDEATHHGPEECD